MKIQVTSKSCGSPAVFSMHWRAGTWLWTACEHLASRKWFKTPDCITSCRDSFHQLHIGALHPSVLIEWLLTGNNNLLRMQHREINLQMQGCVNMSFFSKSSQQSRAPLNPELQPALLVIFHAAWYVTVYLRLEIENFPLNLQVTPWVTWSEDQGKLSDDPKHMCQTQGLISCSQQELLACAALNCTPTIKLHLPQCTSDLWFPKWRLQDQFF